MEWRHEVVQKYDAILPDNLTTQGIKESEAYKTYYAFATGKTIPKPKYVRRSTKEKTEQAPEASSEVKHNFTALNPVVLVHMKELVLHQGFSMYLNIDLDDGDNAAHDDDDEQTESDNDGDDFVHPKFSTHDEEDKEEDSINPRSSSVSSGFVSNMLNLSPDTSINPIFNLNTESSSLVDVYVTSTPEAPLLSAITLFPPPTPLITQMQQTPVPTPANVLSSSLAVSSIPGIIDAYLANKMHETVKTAVQLQSDKLKDEAQAKNEDFFNKLDENIQKIIKEQVKEHNKTLPAAHGPTQPWISNLAQKDDSRNSFNELTDTLDFSDHARVCWSSNLDWNNPEGQQYPQDLRKPLPLIPNSRGRRVIPFDHFINNDLEYLMVVSQAESIQLQVKFRLAMTNMHSGESRIVGKNDNRDDDKLYKLKEVNFNRLRIQDIEDMLLLLIQGKLTNLTLKERLAFNVSLRMFTKSIVIKRCLEDLQLGVQSYQKKINLTKPDTYSSDLKQKEAYTAYFNPRGFIYQNKDKKNRLMRIDQLHKFSDGTLNDVRTALDDCLKGIWMQYLPQTIWRRSDKDKAGAMIQAIDKQLKTRRIMRSLEKFVGGRLYEGDFRLLQRTI
nr:hypothetical protein [Tanacetum cinerariifolium]